jgi:uncharacterized protein (TIGR00730 family)
MARVKCHIPAMSTITSICVYCGSSAGKEPAFAAAAREFGRVLGENKIQLVYGGGTIGLMGALATAVLEHGGTVKGIIPEFLTVRERMHSGVTDLIVTRDLHERKKLMFEHADAFVALPGGVGTLEELVEQLTWAQLGRHRKPVLIANIAGFWDPLCALFDHMNALGFIHSFSRFNYLVCDRVADILPALTEAAAKIPEGDKAMREATLDRM